MDARTDQELLKEFANSRSEAAFAELVRRHVDLVYSAALRMLRDSHHAQDVTQSVFVALAQNCAKVSSHPVLSGWLHRATQNLAANTVRANHRRQVREQEAVIMNELISGESDAVWEDVAPHLDAALAELNEADRDAVFLRYFEKKSAEEIARQLGISNEAAQKRVSRAVERLRDVFGRRGIAVGTASLAVAISTNAAQAAPAGLASAISSSIALTGAGLSVAATATAKTIAMTTLQKTIVATTIAVVTGVGLYEARENAQLRKEAAVLRQAQAPLRAQLQALEIERSNASNELAALTSQMAQIRTDQRNAELLRLRGQVGALRQQLTAAAESNAMTSGFAKMMSDPAMRNYIRFAMVDLVKRRYAAFFEESKLTPEQIDQFTRIIADHFQAGAQNLAVSQSGSAPTTNNQQSDEVVGAKLKALLGEELAGRMKQYTQEVPARTTVDLLNVELGAARLTADQNKRLLDLVKSEPFELTHGISGDVDPAFFGPQAELDEYLMRIVESNQRVLQKAGEFLNDGQLTALNTVLTNGLNARITQAAAFSPKR